MIHCHDLRALRSGVPVARRVNNVQLVAQHEGVNILLRQFFFQACHRLLIPFKRKAIGFCRFRRPFFACLRTQKQLFAGAEGAAFHEICERGTCGAGLHAVHFIHAREKAGAEQRHASVLEHVATIRIHLSPNWHRLWPAFTVAVAAPQIDQRNAPSPQIVWNRRAN